jgi:hypothetical protein
MAVWTVFNCALSVKFWLVLVCCDNLDSNSHELPFVLQVACLPSALAWVRHPGTWALLLGTWVGQEGHIKDHPLEGHHPVQLTMPTRMGGPERLRALALLLQAAVTTVRLHLEPHVCI